MRVKILTHARFVETDVAVHAYADKGKIDTSLLFDRVIHSLAFRQGIRRQRIEKVNPRRRYPERFEEVAAQEKGTTALIVRGDTDPFIQADKCAFGKIHAFAFRNFADHAISDPGGISCRKAEDAGGFTPHLPDDLVGGSQRQRFVVLEYFECHFVGGWLVRHARFTTHSRLTMHDLRLKLGDRHIGTCQSVNFSVLFTEEVNVSLIVLAEPQVHAFASA